MVVKSLLLNGLLRNGISRCKQYCRRDCLREIWARCQLPLIPALTSIPLHVSPIPNLSIVVQMMKMPSGEMAE